jgi:hypothetical protein
MIIPVNYLFTVLIFLFFQSIIFAQGGPPMLTDDPVPVEKGHWEINNAIGLEHNHEIGDEFEVPLVDINYGLSNSIQLKYEVPFILKHTFGSILIGGIGKSNFGVKWRFLNNEKYKISISTYPQFLFNNTPVSSKREITEEGIELSLPFEFLKEFENYSIAMELARDFESKDQGEWRFGLLYDRTLSKRVEIGAEISGISDYTFKNNLIFFNAGSRIKLNEHFKFLLSVGNNFIVHNSEENKFIGYYGLQITF